jgi:hypothetical protein
MVLLMLGLSIAAVAESPAKNATAEFDFTGYSYDELIGIKEQLEAELQIRPEAGERILQTGQYVVGKDIAQGIYEVGFVPAEEDDIYTDWYIYDAAYTMNRFYMKERGYDCPHCGKRVKD